MEISTSAIPTIELGDRESVMRDVPAPFDIDVKSNDVRSDTPKRSPSASTSRSSYTPQFSAVSSLILSRIKRESLVPNSPTSDAPAPTPHPDDEPGMKQAHNMSETLSIPMPAGQRPLTAAASIGAVGLTFLGLKRKREQEHEEVDFTQNTISLPMPVSKPVPTPPAATPQMTISKDSVAKKCSKCEQYAWTPQNIIITCNKCSKSWHQKCVFPEITEEKAGESRFACPECATIIGRVGGISEPVSPERQKHVEKMRERNLSAMPEGVVPAKAELVGFYGGHASDSARTEYFYGKKKTDLLNILSFCDQLKPQLLVDVLVSVSKKHPDLPIFDAPNWNAQILGATSVKHKHSDLAPRPVGRPRHGHTVLDSKTKHKHKVTKKILKITSVIESEEMALEENRDSLPPTWPKAGEGLYAKLPLEDEDKAFLLDENDEEAFSHFEVDKFGKQIAVPVCV